MEEKKKKGKKPTIIYHNYPLLALLLGGWVAFLAVSFLLVCLANRYLYGEWPPMDFMFAVYVKMLLAGSVCCAVFWVFRWEYYDDY